MLENTYDTFTWIIIFCSGARVWELKIHGVGWIRTYIFSVGIYERSWLERSLYLFLYIIMKENGGFQQVAYSSQVQLFYWGLWGGVEGRRHGRTYHICCVKMIAFGSNFTQMLSSGVTFLSSHNVHKCNWVNCQKPFYAQSICKRKSALNCSFLQNTTLDQAQMGSSLLLYNMKSRNNFTQQSILPPCLLFACLYETLFSSGF